MSYNDRDTHNRPAFETDKALKFLAEGKMLLALAGLFFFRYRLSQILKLCTLIFLPALLLPELVGAGELHITKEKNRYDLVSSLHYLVDEKGEMDFKKIRKADREGKFIKNDKNSLNFGLSEASYWIRFSFTGNTISKSGWFLEFTYSAIDLYTVYIPNGSGGYKIKKIGDSVSFKKWDVPFFKPTLSMGMELPKDQPIYVNIRTTAVVNIVPILWRTSQFSGHTSSLSLGLGVYYGIMLGLALYNLFIYFSFRDKNYLLYICFVLSYVTSQMTYNGLSYQYLWPSGGWFTNFSYIFTISLQYIPLILFAKSFLQIKKYLPIVNGILSFLVGIFSFLCLANLLIGMKIAGLLLALSGTLTVSIIYISAIVIFIKGLHSARFFLFAWTAFILGFLVVNLKMLGIFPHNFITEYGIQIGSSLEALLLSLALADRINILKKEKEIAQIKVIEETKNSEALKSQFLEKAEKLVEERTRELTKAKNELEKLARVDSLTTLYNRRVFDEVYEKEFSLAQRTEKEFSLLIIDIDFFKKFNDLYGHQKGDDCLQAVACCMQKNAQRITDTLARYGGEEFAVIMTDTDTKNALIIAERIRKGVEELSIPHHDSPFNKVTISLGLATLKQGVDVSHTQLFKKADNALYLAKENGRNKIFNGT